MKSYGITKVVTIHTWGHEELMRHFSLDQSELTFCVYLIL